MGDINVDGDGSEVDRDGDEDGGVDGDGSGALPRPSRVPKQRLLSPESRRWRGRSCGTSSRKLPINLGFSRRRELIGGRAVSEVDQGAHTTPWRG
jgi:hypothetical protein